MSSPYETMAACRQGYGGRDNRGQKEEMAEMRREIEELSQVVQALLRRGRARANREVPGGNSEPVDIPEGSQEDERDEECKENLFHDACYANLDSIAVGDSSVDWETPPIYDEYEEDGGEFISTDIKGLFTSEILSFPSEVKDKSSPNLVNEYDVLKIHSSEEAGFATCKTGESLTWCPQKPVTFYIDPFLLESQMSCLANKDARCIYASTIFLSRESSKYGLKKTTVEALEGATRKLMNSNIQRRHNSEAGRIITHGKIRGRIFSNKGSMMQGDSCRIYMFLYYHSLCFDQQVLRNLVAKGGAWQGSKGVSMLVKLWTSGPSLAAFNCN